jgi:hypothetical protein
MEKKIPLHFEEKEIAPDDPREKMVDEEASDGSASAFEGAEHLREYDDRDLSDKDLDDLLSDDD